MMVSTLLAPRRLPEMAPDTTNEDNEAQETALDHDQTLRTTLEELDESNPMSHYEAVKAEICQWLTDNYAKALAQRGKIQAKLDSIDRNLKTARHSIDFALEPITSSLFTHIDSAKQHMSEICMNIAAKNAKEAAESKPKGKKPDQIKENLANLLPMLNESNKKIGYSKVQRMYSAIFRGQTLPPLEYLRKNELVSTEQKGNKTVIKDEFFHFENKGKDDEKKTGINLTAWKKVIGKPKAK